MDAASHRASISLSNPGGLIHAVASIADAMPGSEYASFGGGALKLKGAKVKKHKKKDKSADLEKNLSTGGESSTALDKAEDTTKKREKRSKSQDEEEEENLPDTSMTEAERRLAEAKQKKVRSCSRRPPSTPIQRERRANNLGGNSLKN